MHYVKQESLVECMFSVITKFIYFCADMNVYFAPFPTLRCNETLKFTQVFRQHFLYIYTAQKAFAVR